MFELLISFKRSSRIGNTTLYAFCMIVCILSIQVNLLGQKITGKDSIRIDNELEAANKNIFKEPAKAKFYLDSISSTVKGNIELEFKWHNIYGVYYGVNGILDSAIYHFQYIIDRVHGDPIRKAGAMHNLGLTYRNSKRYVEAKALFNQSLDLYAEAKDTVNVARVYGSMASIYKDQEMFDLSIKWLEKAISILETDDPIANKELINSEKQKLANTYLMLEQYEMAKEIYEEVIPVFRESNRLYHAMTLLNYTNALYELNELNTAMQTIEEAFSILEDFQQRDYLGLAYFHRAQIYKDEQNFIVAISDLEKAINESKQGSGFYLDEIYLAYLELLVGQKKYTKANEIAQQVMKDGVYSNTSLKNKVLFNKRMAQILFSVNDYKGSAEFWDMAFALRDSLGSLNKEKIAAELREKYQTELLKSDKDMLEAQRDALEQRVSVQRLSLFLIIATVLLLAIIIYQLRLRGRIKDLALVKLEQENILAQKENSLMELQLTARNQMIDQQKQQLLASTLDAARRNEMLANVLEEAKKSGETISAQLLQKIQLDENYWDQLIQRFSELHPGFLEQLHQTYPELSRNDLEFCALVKLNLSYKDIASLLNISHRSVFTKKYRITQKMQVSDDGDFLELIRQMG